MLANPLGIRSSEAACGVRWTRFSDTIPTMPVVVCQLAWLTHDQNTAWQRFVLSYVTPREVIDVHAPTHVFAAAGQNLCVQLLPSCFSTASEGDVVPLVFKGILWILLQQGRVNKRGL